MTYFILQTLFWLLLAFIAGLLLGKWLKPLFCQQDNARFRKSDKSYAGESASAASASVSERGATSYSGTADKLAFRDNEFETSSTTLASSTSKVVAASTAVIATRNNEREADAFVGSDSQDLHTLFDRLDISNLRVIEGIGPVMEKVLHEHGVHNWTDLSRQSDTDLRDILDHYDDKYKGVEIEGWVEQAKLAASGKVEELITLQKQDEGDETSQLEVWLNKLRVR